MDETPDLNVSGSGTTFHRFFVHQWLSRVLGKHCKMCGTFCGWKMAGQMLMKFRFESGRYKIIPFINNALNILVGLVLFFWIYWRLWIMNQVNLLSGYEFKLVVWHTEQTSHSHSAKGTTVTRPCRQAGSYFLLIRTSDTDANLCTPRYRTGALLQRQTDGFETL
jgi:hypothetical protein